MKKYQYFVMLVMALTLISCGSSSSTTPTPTPTPSDTVTLSGTLGTGTIANIGVKANPAAVGYDVIIVNNASNKTYQATTDSSGGFSVDVPTDTSYLISLVNSGSYIGPVVFDGSGSAVNEVVTPSEDADLGETTVDTISGYARTVAVPSAVDTSVTTVASNGIPLGAGNDGKTENSGITNRDDSDEDKDGIPNIFDADEDNDGIRNGVESLPSSSEVVSDVVESVYMTSNIWADHNTTEAAKDIIAMWLNVIPISGQETQIASVQCTGIPSVISGIATIRWSESLGNPTGYPAEGSLWSDASYNLYQTTTLPREQWIISVTPRAIMSVGDTFTIRATYTDATYEDFYVVMSYILTDWSKIITYNDTAMPAATGTKTAPVEYDSDSLVIVFSKPLDEDGNILEGLTYSISYGVSDCSSGTCDVPTTVSEPVTDTGADTLTATITTTTAATTYYVAPVAESADGQRNGEETWFTRQ